MKKVVIVIAVIMLLLLVDEFLIPRDGLTVSVQATVRVPTDDPYYIRENNGYKDTWIRANDQAYISKGEHGAPYRAAVMSNGTLKSGMGYGPISVKGSINAARLMEACPGLVLEKDWEFVLGMFNTSNGKRVKMYLDLIVYQDSLTAKATLYMFYEGYAHPVIYEDDVIIGDAFGFGVEI